MTIPVNTTLPIVIGIAPVGKTITALLAHGPELTGYLYQWNRFCVPIAGATASTYVPIAADVGNTLTVSLGATNSGGSSLPATSAPTGAATA